MFRTISRTISKVLDVPHVSTRSIFSSTALYKDEATNQESGPPTVLVEKDANITLIGINRPNQRNAINAATAAKLCEAFTEFENDDESPVAVLYGIGGSFCSGYDILELGADGKNISTDILMSAEGSVGPTRRHIKKPVICGVNGYCVANGLELALMCDLRVMEESAIMGFFNRRFGVPVIDGGTARLPAMIGFSRALDLILTGRQLSAKEAFEMGIANRIVATGTALGQAVNLAFTIAKFPQAALNHDRNSLYSATFESHNFNQAIHNEVMYTSRDVIDQMKEGIRKFNEGHIRTSSTENVKEKSMADWERGEIEIEKELQKEREHIKNGNGHGKEKKDV